MTKKQLVNFDVKFLYDNGNVRCVEFCIRAENSTRATEKALRELKNTNWTATSIHDFYGVLCEKCDF